MRLVGALLCVLALACCIQGKETGELGLCALRATALGVQSLMSILSLQVDNFLYARAQVLANDF